MDIDPQPITNWFALILAIGGTVTLLTGVVFKINRSFEKRVSNLIKETTKPIQPLTNGGLSLTDLHNKVDRIETRYSNVLDEQAEQREAWHARYLKDQERIRKEWTAVFVAIRKMIHLPAEEQADMWDDITEAYINGTIAEQFPDERKMHGQVQEP